MVRFDVESPVSCDTCGNPAIRRTVNVVFPGKGGCQVSFDTHHDCITAKEWLAAITRMETFYLKLFIFMGKLPSGHELSIGQIEQFDFRAVHPDACTHREFVCIVARVRAFGLKAEIETRPRPLKGLRVNAVLKELGSLAEDAALKLKSRFDKGQF